MLPWKCRKTTSVCVRAWARACVRSLHSCVRSSVLAYVVMFIRFYIRGNELRGNEPVYMRSCPRMGFDLRTWDAWQKPCSTHFYSFFTRFTSPCNANTHFCHFCIWISRDYSFYFHSCITIPFSLNFTWIMNLMTSLLFCSHHPLMLAREAPIRWWSDSTCSPPKLEAMFKRQALSPSSAFFQKSPQVPPWCSALLKGGGTLPTPFISPSGRWRWLPMTSTTWPALVSRGPSLVLLCVKRTVGHQHVGEEVLHWNYLLLRLGVGLHVPPTKDHGRMCSYG